MPNTLKCLRALADPTRLRILALLEREDREAALALAPERVLTRTIIVHILREAPA